MEIRPSKVMEFSGELTEKGFYSKLAIVDSQFDAFAILRDDRPFARSPAQPRPPAPSAGLAVVRRPPPAQGKPPNKYANEFASSHEECRDAASWSRCWQVVPRGVAQGGFRPQHVRPA